MNSIKKSKKCLIFYFLFNVVYIIDKISVNLQAHIFTKGIICKDWKIIVRDINSQSIFKSFFFVEESVF